MILGIDLCRPERYMNSVSVAQGLNETELLTHTCCCGVSVARLGCVFLLYNGIGNNGNYAIPKKGRFPFFFFFVRFWVFRRLWGIFWAWNNQHNLATQCGARLVWDGKERNYGRGCKHRDIGKLDIFTLFPVCAT